jgi:hypothetical protein
VLICTFATGISFKRPSWAVACRYIWAETQCIFFFNDLPADCRVLSIQYILSGIWRIEFSPSALAFLRLFWEVTPFCTQCTHFVPCPQIPGCCTYSTLNFLCLLYTAGPNFYSGKRRTISLNESYSQLFPLWRKGQKISRTHFVDIEKGINKRKVFQFVWDFWEFWALCSMLNKLVS